MDFILAFIQPVPAIVMIFSVLLGIISALPNISTQTIPKAIIRTIAGTASFLTGIWSAGMTLLSIPHQSNYLVGLWGRSTLLLLATALILFILAIPPVITSISSYSKRMEAETYQDELDSILIDNNLMPLQRRRQKVYMRKRREDRHFRTLYKNQFSYNCILLTDEVEDELRKIAIQPEEEHPRLLSELAWKMAAINNPDADCENPTVALTKGVYQDVAVLFKELNRFKDTTDKPDVCPDEETR